MPFCPKCKTEYTAGRERCADCGEALVETLERQEAMAVGPSGAVAQPAQLCVMEDMLAMTMLEAQLHMAGIASVRQARATAVYVPAARLAEARQIMEGEAAGPPPPQMETVGLSDLHTIRLVCSECDKETSVDLRSEQLPATCECGHVFDLSAARNALDRYADLVRIMEEADFDIELEMPGQAW